MTDSTADAAKPLPCHDNEWHLVGEGTPLNVWLETKREGENGTNVCFCRLLVLGDEPEWVEQPPHGRTTITHHTFAAPTHWRWNTRQQPAPPVGGLDREQIIEAIYDNIEIVDGPYGESRTELIGLDKAADAILLLGLAARPKVEDAEVVTYAAALRDLERLSADLHTNETQLAQADAVINILAGCGHVRWSVDDPRQDWLSEALVRHADNQSRQQAAKDTDDHRASKEGETR